MWPGIDVAGANEERASLERALRAAVLDGDEGAWRVLYDRTWARLHAFVRRRTGERSELAEEVLQECWMVGVRRLGSFDPGRGPFAGWLEGIAENVIRSLHRRHRRDPTSCLVPEAMPVATPEPEDVTTAAVAQVLAELPDRYRAVLEEKYAECRTVNEIAERWGETPKTVESLLTRARAAFRSAWTQGVGTEI